MNYDEMSDLEINLQVAISFGIFDDMVDGYVHVSIEHDGDNVISVTGCFDPCNVASDAWPIIESIWDDLFDDDNYYHSHCVWDAQAMKNSEQSKLRAAMVCYLKMKTE